MYFRMDCSFFYIIRSIPFLEDVVGSALKGMFLLLCCLMSLEDDLKLDPLDPKFYGALELVISLFKGLIKSF